MILLVYVEMYNSVVLITVKAKNTDLLLKYIIYNAFGVLIIYDNVRTS